MVSASSTDSKPGVPDEATSTFWPCRKLELAKDAGKGRLARLVSSPDTPKTLSIFRWKMFPQNGNWATVQPFCSRFRVSKTPGARTGKVKGPPMLAAVVELGTSIRVASNEPSDWMAASKLKIMSAASAEKLLTP